MPEPTYPVPPDLDDPKFQRMFEYWLSKFRDGRLPARADIDPVEIRDLLGHINIIQVIRESDRTRFRYSLWGTKVTELYGRDFTGKYLDDIIIPTKVSEIQRVFEEVVETGQPVFQQISYLHHQTVVSFERLVLPFSQSGSEVDVLLEASDWAPGVHQDLRNIDFSRTQDLTPDTD